jgi:hypothetical protein
MDIADLIKHISAEYDNVLALLTLAIIIIFNYFFDRLVIKRIGKSKNNSQ